MYVTSILYSTDKPSVVIGERIVYLNQEVNGAVIVEINTDNVVFEKEGRRWTQKLAEEMIQDSLDENLHQD